MSEYHIRRCDQCGREERMQVAGWFRVDIIGIDTRTMDSPAWILRLPTDFCSVECLLHLGAPPQSTKGGSPVD